MTTFQTIGLQPELLQAIEELGYVTPTSIQEQAIPKLLEGDCDFLGLAQTGTGKTAAFGLPMLQKTDLTQNVIQGLVICPTRELCLQITEDLKSYSKHKGNLRVLAIYGGSSIQQQIRDLRRGVQIIVATPGRMIDIIERGEIKLENVKYVVLDEADEMLNMGFKEDIHHILSYTPEQKNTWLFSATMPKEIRNIANQFMTNPLEVQVGERNSGNANIAHKYFVVKSRDRYTTLKRMVDVNPSIYGIIFTRTKADAQEIAEHLIKDKYNADALHGDLSQQQRDKVMGRFRDRSLQILVATDVAARGIDVNDITHVINYSLPDDDESYTHRSGRTGRAGKLGICMSIIHIKELHRVGELERKIKMKFEKSQIPTGIEVCEAQLMNIVHEIGNIDVNEDQIGKFLPQVMEEFEKFSKEDLIKKLVSQEFNHFLNYYKDAPDLNLPDNKRDDARQRQPDAEKNYAQIQVMVGNKDGLNSVNLLEMIDSVAGIFKRKVGRILIENDTTYFEIESYEVPRLMSRLKDFKVGRKSLMLSEYNGDVAYTDNPNPRRESGYNRGGGGFGGARDGQRSSGGYRGGNDRGGNDRGGDRNSGGGYRGGNDRGASGGGYKGSSDRNAGGGYNRTDSRPSSRPAASGERRPAAPRENRFPEYGVNAKPDAPKTKPSEGSVKKEAGNKKYDWDSLIGKNDDLKW